jgi:cell migration-inducing and hyaluronan-binding protein
MQRPATRQVLLGVEMLIPAHGLTLGRRFGAAAAISLLSALLLALGASARAEMPTMCGGGNQLPVPTFPMPGGQPDLVVNGVCNVNMAQNGANPTVFYYGNVNIVSGGSLNFNQPATENPNIDFWASSIIVEANGALTAGTPNNPYGNPRLLTKDGGFLTIHLYGKNQSVSGGAPVDPATMPGQGVLCKSAGAGLGPCGIPNMVWTNNGATILPGCGATPTTSASDCIPGLPTNGGDGVDYFYQYGPLYGDNLCSDMKTKWTAAGGCPSGTQVGYFGYKVLAVSYGGTLTMYGYKGTGIDGTPVDSGNSWMRLSGDLNPTQGPGTLTVSGTPSQRWWLPSDGTRDQAVVTTTDYLPGHSEVLTIGNVQGNQVNFNSAVKWFHSGTLYPIGSKITDATAKQNLIAAGMDSNLVKDGADVRAAVALLTRNIRIVSEGDTAGETFAQAAARTTCPPNADNLKTGCYYFGGHTIFRQGFRQIQMDGVEFANLGQGGKLGHYPIHFHETRQVPPKTYVNDSSVNQSSTRWYVLHSTQGVTFQRDVGWKSIGHGYYLEAGTETDNNLYSDLGIFARAAIDNPQNPQKTPGILADNHNPDPKTFVPLNNANNVANPGMPYRSDNEYPTVFWITNGWNNFQGDMAAGAGACGAAYWFVPLQNSDTPDVPTTMNTDSGKVTPLAAMKWDYGPLSAGSDKKNRFGYAGEQRALNPAINMRDATWAGSSPMESFYGNYATATMMSFQTTLDAPACNGFITAQQPALTTPTVKEITSFSPPPVRGPKPKDATGATQADGENDPYYPHDVGAKFTTACVGKSTAQVPELPARYDCSEPPPGHSPPPGLRSPCTDGSTQVIDPNNNENPCTPTVIDHFTSSFHWAQGNVSAVWLRPLWYLVANSVITDVQQGGITFVTGGDVTRSSIISGYWGLLRDSILVGHTQPQDAAHRFASDIGPFNSYTNSTDKLTCEQLLSSDAVPDYCLSRQEGISMPVSGFFNNQRLENIYDGPSYRDSNAYLDVSVSGCPADGYNGAGGCIYGSGKSSGILKDPTPNSTTPCYLPNAAIAWKQPNGFFYPPAFHAENLYFNGGVQIRHFVIDPLFKAFSGSVSPYKSPPPMMPSPDFGQGGSYLTDTDAVNALYCQAPKGAAANIFFNGFTSIDRQTELNDDDGSLTGLSNNLQPTLDPPNPLKQTISVNEDDFFTAPVETPECESNISNANGANSLPTNACIQPSKAAPTVTAKTSPYDYVSTIVYHTEEGGIWTADCTNPQCYGVPLYRQFLAGVKGTNAATSTREWKHWYQNGCNTDPTKFGITQACRWPFIRMAGTAKNTRETLTINNGTYYLDTTVPKTIQQTEQYNGENAGSSLNTSFNVFQPDTKIDDHTFIGTYNVFFAYAKPTTRQTYQIYLGPNATAADIKAIQVRLDTLNNQPDFPTKQPWLTTDTTQIATSGIVSVTVDFTKLTDGTLDLTSPNGLCQPRTFCKWDDTNKTCGSALDDHDPNFNQSVAVCKEWAVKDLDCPPMGCYGFSFTIPKTGFAANATLTNPSPNRPAPVEFPSTAINPDGSKQGTPTWIVKFLQTTKSPDATNGSCHYTTLPSYPPPVMGECTVPDWVPQ